MTKNFIYLTIITLFISCETNNQAPDCSAVLCTAPHVLINLIDKTTEENYILKNNINKESILIHDTSHDDVEFSIDDMKGWLFVDKQNNKDTFEIYINSEIITKVSFESTNPKTNECCDFGVLKNVLVEDKEFEVEENLISIYL